MFKDFAISVYRQFAVQIWVSGPSQENNIAVPDASGVFVVAALAPLYVNASGTVLLAQSEIVQVGQLTAGSIGPGFGMLFLAPFNPLHGASNT